MKDWNIYFQDLKY